MNKAVTAFGVRPARLLLACGLAYVVLYFAFYPHIYTSIDEADTFSMAYVLRHGSLFPPAAYNVPELNPPGLHGNIYRFPIGFPAILALLTFVGWRAFFLVNPLLHLAATEAFARLLAAQRLSRRWAVLYLFFPPFVLFARTLFSDLFAASLTTIALCFLLQRRTAFGAGLCLGLASLARPVCAPVAAILFLGLLARDWRQQRPLGRSAAWPFLLGLVPFVLANMAYNAAVLGGPFKSTYSAGELSLANAVANGPLYALSLCLIYPGMLLAPLLYRGRFWREGLVASAIVVAAAVCFEEITHGNNILQTLLSTPRQILPVLPFFLLAYTAVLARWARLLPVRVPRGPAWGAMAFLLIGLAGGISLLHQKYLHSLLSLRDEMSQTLPPGSVIYANKDAFKLHQVVWDAHTFRELPYVSDAQAREDLGAGPVFVALYTRSRGFGGEDAANTLITHDLSTQFLLADGPASRSGMLRFSRILGVRTQNKPGSGGKH